MKNILHEKGQSHYFLTMIWLTFMIILRK